MKFHVRRRASPVITIVSLIDILTILLIFFIVTTTFKNPQPQVVITVPAVKSAVQKSAATAPVILGISAEGDIFLDDKPVGLAELGQLVKNLQEKNRTIGMKADEKAPVGRMFEVLDALQIAGVKNMPAFTRTKK